MNFTSSLIENAVNEFSKLPGIGKRTALRLVLHFLQQPKEDVSQFSDVVKKMREDILFCKKCHNVSDKDLCRICTDNHRNSTVVCIVESIREVMAIENTGQFSGTYHVLGGVISPLNGVSPESLQIQSLLTRVEQDGVKEIIMALNPTIDGDTTVFYLSQKLKPLNVAISTIARGVAFGGELEYVDEITLARSISSRLPYENHTTAK